MTIENGNEGEEPVQTHDDRRVSRSQLRPDQDEVSVRVPAVRRYVSPLRSLTTTLAAQCELTVDQIEDMQIAIDEVCALLLPHVDRSRPWLDVRFHLVDGHFVACVAVATPAPVQIDRTALAWTVLSALSDDVEVKADGRTLEVCFSKRRSAERA
jgi:serine/threonine-protein kinase RsbW